MTADFDDAIDIYFPSPICTRLCKLKAEIGCGMDAEQSKGASKLDNNWQTNGRFGVLHFGNSTSN
jgi:hypothetical protein